LHIQQTSLTELRWTWRPRNVLYPATYSETESSTTAAQNHECIQAILLENISTLFVVNLTTPFSYQDYKASNKMVVSEWRIGKDLKGRGSGLILRYYPGIRLEGLRKTTKNLSKDSRSPGRDLNLGPPEYEAGVSITQQRRSILVEHSNSGKEVV
jgi:hypothetical protein